MNGQRLFGQNTILAMIMNMIMNRVSCHLSPLRHLGQQYKNFNRVKKQKKSCLRFSLTWFNKLLTITDPKPKTTVKLKRTTEKCIKVQEMRCKIEIICELAKRTSTCWWIFPFFNGKLNGKTSSCGFKASAKKTLSWKISYSGRSHFPPSLLTWI